jgi:hypothetical protein
MTSISPYSPPSSTNQQRSGHLSVNNIPLHKWGEAECKFYALASKAFKEAVGQEKAERILFHATMSPKTMLNISHNPYQKTPVVTFSKVIRFSEKTMDRPAGIWTKPIHSSPIADVASYVEGKTNDELYKPLNTLA